MLNRLASLTMSTSVLKALPGKLDIKGHSPSILYFSECLAMSPSILKALPGKLDIKRHSPSILYFWASLAMSKSALNALPSKLDFKRHSPSILYFQNMIWLNIRSLALLGSQHGQNAEKVTHIKGRLLYQATIIYNNVPFQNGNFS